METMYCIMLYDRYNILIFLTISEQIFKRIHIYSSEMHFKSKRSYNDILSAQKLFQLKTKR